MAGPPNLVALVGGTLIDGNGGVPIRDSRLIVEGNRIREVGGPGAIPSGAEVIRVDGKTVLPGLIDSHVHVGSSSGGQATAQEYSPETRAAKMKSWLLFGVTTIMDMGQNAFLDRIKADIDSGALVGPRVFGVKHAITAPGSHPTGLSRELRLADREGGNLHEVATPEEARAAVRRAAADKPDGLKIHHTRSEFPGTSCLDCNLEKQRPETLRALIDEGHAQGLRVFAHIAWPSEAREVVEAGADCIAHPITHAETGAQPVIEMMAARGIRMHTTLTRIEGYFVFKVDPFLREKLRGKVPDAVLDSLGLPNSISRMRHESAAVEGDARRIMQVAMANVKRANKAGMTIVLGTDSGGPGHLHGAVVPREMEILNDCGLTPMQVILAATRNAAECIGQRDSLGTLEAGKLADAIVIEGDPLRDISNMRKLDLVIKDGVVFDPRQMRLN